MSSVSSRPDTARMCSEVISAGAESVLGVVSTGTGSVGPWGWVCVCVGSSGVVGVEALVFGRAASRFFSSVFRKTLMVVLSDL